MIRRTREPQSKRHIRSSYYVLGEGVFTDPGEDVAVEPTTPSTIASLRKFRFSRLGPRPENGVTSRTLREALAKAMTPDPAGPAGEGPESSHPAIPAGFTYLGQFIDHDLTLDATGRDLEADVTVEELVQGRSPALDLDTLYGRGPQKPQDRKFYGPDGVRLRIGKTQGVQGDSITLEPKDGFDLPRVGIGSTIGERRTALIPDARNDENLAVAQLHCAFIRFHNRVVADLEAKGLSGTALFDSARELVVKHYQWMLRTDYLIQIVDDKIVDGVFKHGRSYFDVAPPYPDASTAGTEDAYRTLQPGDTPTMPIEFSVAAFRLGHSMVRPKYEWNRVFNSKADSPGRIADGTLRLLFVFSATSGNFTPFPPDDDNPDAGAFESLPTNWIVDFPRLFDFRETGRPELIRPADQFNLTKRIDTLLVDPLRLLPLGSFGARGTTVPEIERNLAFRNLTRGNMVKLASGQEMAEFFQLDKSELLTPEEIEGGKGGAVLGELSEEDRLQVIHQTPLWFYILREAEVRGNGRLTGVGGRIVAETFHRAMEGSRHSIVRDPTWRPTLGPDENTFRMSDLLLYAFEGKAELLNPLGETPPA
jgi:hypothetical protein